MFTLAQPSYGYYNPYQELAMQQELQRRRQLEAYLRRQREAEEMERRRAEYEAAVRAEYERRREAELERRRQAELQRRRQAQQAHGRYSMYDGGLESLFDALYGGQRREEPQPNVPARKSPTPTPRNPTPTPAPGSVSLSTPASAPAAAEPEPEEPQIDTAPSYAAVQSILASFATLQSEFTFPTQLDFQPGSSKLAYTPNNAPLHGYEHALTGLLTKLDAVDSYGDSGVRKARKEAVKTIEKELERLDGMKVEAWNRLSAPQPEAGMDPLSVPLPEDSIVEDEEMSEVEQASEATISEELPTIGQLSEPEEPLAPTEPTTIDQTEPTTVDQIEPSVSLEPSVDDVSEPLAVTQPTLDTQPATLSEIRNNATVDSLHSPELDPLARSMTSPTPSEASESDSDSDLELEEYVDLESMATSEAEDTELEEVENDEDLELMRGWDLDF